MTYDELLLAINMLDDRLVTLTTGRPHPEGVTLETTITGKLRVPQDPYTLLDAEARAVAERSGPEGFLIDPDEGAPFWCGLSADRYLMAEVLPDGVINLGFEDLPESGLPPLALQINPHDKDA